MCLLVVLSRLRADAPLVVAANRDEFFHRPALAMTVLAGGDDGPRVLGGRDELAGGTWLAVNDAGVVAGLTNRPNPGGRDLTKRSRGELPLALAAHADAATAVARLAETVRPGDYNPAWLLVGDRRSLYSVDLTGTEVVVEELPPGVHVLENRPLREASAKSERVRALVAPLVTTPPDRLVSGLAAVLADHERPTEDEPGDDPERPRRAETLAACVHSDDYGTRSSTIVVVPPTVGAFADVRYVDGAPCVNPWQDATALWPAPRPDGALGHFSRSYDAKVSQR